MLKISLDDAFLLHVCWQWRKHVLQSCEKNAYKYFPRKWCFVNFSNSVFKIIVKRWFRLRKYVKKKGFEVPVTFQSTFQVEQLPQIFPSQISQIPNSYQTWWFCLQSQLHAKWWQFTKTDCKLRREKQTRKSWQVKISIIYTWIWFPRLEINKLWFENILQLFLLKTWNFCENSQI